MDTVEKIAETVLYEGYLLYPYTRSSLKNQARWTLGGIYPRSFSEATGGGDPWLMQTQCLVMGDTDTTLHIKVRFLHVVDRRILEKAEENGGEDRPLTPNSGGTGKETVGAGLPRPSPLTPPELGAGGRSSPPAMRPVEALRVGEQVYRPWEEAMEREVSLECKMGDLAGRPQQAEIVVSAGQSEETLTDAAGNAVGAIIREWQPVQGSVEIAAESLGELGFRLTARIVNATPWTGTDRKAVIRQTLVSTHTILRVSGGEFLSLLEPPPAYEEAARGCENIKTWPVLVGDKGDRHVLLSSPIILYDYPQVSPETAGDLFDGTEIDELLRFSILALTDDEKQEMRESDARGRAILERTEALSPDDLLSLHAVVRNLPDRSGGQ